MEVRKDILWRVHLVYFLICLFALAIIGQVIRIQFAEGDYWREKAEQYTTKYRDIKAVRGNIFAADESLLATSVPFYEVGMDVNTEYLTDERFYGAIDELSQKLANLLQNRTATEFKEGLIKARKSGRRYFLIKRNASYNELQAMKKFPLFEKGRYKGGFVYLQTNKRKKPFKVLAARTIGYSRENVQPVGLEGAYNEYLEGVSGQRLMQKIAGGVWMPINDKNEVEPEDGCDVITTIDVNIQDVAEHALLKQLEKHNAGYGTVVLMEVATGEIKAIANLSRKDTSRPYYENYNYAIGAATEPGSTFKLAALMVALEDGRTTLKDTVDLEKGYCKYYDRVMRDSHAPDKRFVTVKRAFEVSSNVGISKIIHNGYAKDPKKFVEGLYKIGLHQPLGLNIKGEGTPRIKHTADKDWYGTTLPWMSIGYEVLLTPLQTLTFYNAVANNGTMVKPKFVREVRKSGKVIEEFETEVINPAICSERTLKQVREMLEGVVTNGTARNLKAASYHIAGKTGTAQIASKGSYNKKSYLASFAGYFPAENPKYSCIVVVSAPSRNVYYGNLVAGPIFKEIADKVYSSSLEIHEEINNKTEEFLTRAPRAKHGDQAEVVTVLNELNVPLQDRSKSSAWVKAQLSDTSTVEILKADFVEELKKGIMPDVSGMMAKDVIYLLENNGLRVRVNGRGIVNKQSIKAGSKIYKGSIVELHLS